MRGDRSFAYDLFVRSGPVSCKHALLCGSAEGKPVSIWLTRYRSHSSRFELCHHLMGRGE
jgi:hypothetical protein